MFTVKRDVKTLTHPSIKRKSISYILYNMNAELLILENLIKRFLSRMNMNLQIIRKGLFCVNTKGVLLECRTEMYKYISARLPYSMNAKVFLA